jgi:hypothetical protein
MIRKHILPNTEMCEWCRSMVDEFEITVVYTQKFGVKRVCKICHKMVSPF